MYLYRTLFALILSALLASSVMATQLDDLQKVGKAKLQVWFFDVYMSELYSPSGQYQAGQFPLALKIRYLRDIESQSLIEQTRKQWLHLGYSDKQTQRWLTRLARIWPDIKANDELTLVARSADESEFYFNDQSLATIEDSGFGQQFLAIWLDEKSNYPSLRKQLIGAKQ